LRQEREKPTNSVAVFSSFILHPSSFILHPSSFLNPSQQSPLDSSPATRYGTTMMRGELPPAPIVAEWADATPQPRRRRRWRDKFREAFHGVKLGVRGHSSFSVHFFFAALAVAAAIALECTLVEWCLVLLCIGGVITAELFNSAIETLFRGLDEATRSRWNGSLDIAAGAVLVASITAVIVGAIIFLNRFIKLLHS
jgi:diacylglycerol kinase